MSAATLAAAAAVDIGAVAAAAPQSDEELLSSMGLSQSLAAELLSSAEELMERYGAETTVEKFLEAHCHAHVSALQAYCEQRVGVMQQEGEQAIEAIKAEYAPVEQ